MSEKKSKPNAYPRLPLCEEKDMGGRECVAGKCCRMGWCARGEDDAKLAEEFGHAAPKQ